MLRSITAAADPVGPVFATRVEALATGAGRAAEADVAGEDPDQDADDPWPLQRFQLRSRVVVREDEAVVLAVLGVAVGAVLAHADAVAEPVALDDPGDARLGGRAGQQERDREQGCESDSHPCSNRFGADKSRPARAVAPAHPMTPTI